MKNNLIFLKTIKFLLIICMIVTFFGCKKDDKADENSQFEGTWEMKSTTNGLNGIKIDYQSGNGNLIILKGNNYQVFSNHHLEKSGTFQIIAEISILTKTKGNRIIYDNNPDQVRTFVEVKDSILGLSIDAFDGPSSSYIKKK